MRNNLNFMRRVLYKLRQDFGRPVTLVQVGDITVNYKTGAQEQTKITYVLPKVVRLQRQTSSFARIGMALGIFNRGGETDKTFTDFIIDAAILPDGVVPDLRGNYLIVESKRYNILKVVELDSQLGYLVTTEAYEGSEQ